jgi:dimethylargininase
MFTRAIVCSPAPNFAEGLTAARLGAPNYEDAIEQHAAYCSALERCGLTLTRLDADPNYPDSTFVEDAAILTESCAVLTRPGAPSRRGEVEGLRNVLSQFFPSLHEIESPGTLDGGDVCQAGHHFFIGLSARTNETGAHQLAKILEHNGYSSTIVDLTQQVSEPGASATGSLLHLKSGLAWLGNNCLALADDLASRPEFAHYDLVRVSADEQYAANCVRVNDYILIAAGYPRLQDKLRALGYETIALEMSEFQKMDGGLSCLSLRF